VQQQTQVSSEREESVPPAGCTRYTVKLTKPMGIVLDQAS
jgi:hypothetical protein